MNKPTPEHTQEVLEKVEKIASVSGYTLDRHPGGTMLVCGFDMGGGRSQLVYITHSGQTPDGKDTISFMSPCMEVKRGFFAGLSKKMAIELLRRNAMMMFGAFALESMDDADMLMVCSNQIVDTMDVEEFQAHVNYVALVADEFEREQGQDVF